MDHHQIGQHSITLVPPRSMAVRWEVFSLGAHSSLRASAAALAVCWKGPGKPAATLERHSWNVGRWAGAVLDELLGRGVAGVYIIWVHERQARDGLDVFTPQREPAGGGRQRLGPYQEKN